MDVFEAIYNHRSIRAYRPDAVPDELFSPKVLAYLQTQGFMNNG